MINEEQARKLWCPMVRLAAIRPDGAVVDGQTVFNRLQNGPNTAIPDAGRCIAGECAMWRWVPGTTHHKERKIEERKYALPGGKMAMRKVVCEVDVPDAPTLGYCGLAGRPEVAP